MRISSSRRKLLRGAGRTGVALVATLTMIASSLAFGLSLTAQVAAAQETCAPEIDTVSAVAATPTQTVTITGSCFGDDPSASGLTSYAYTGDSGYFSIADVNPAGQPPWWDACFSDNQSGTNLITCHITSWSDTSITFTGFTGDYGSYNWFLTDGDPLVISVWDADTVGTADPLGPANCTVTVGSGPTTCAQPSLPTSSATTTETSPSSNSITPGGRVTDTATVTGETVPGDFPYDPSVTDPSGDPLAGIPAGSVSFYVCGPSLAPQLCSTSTAVDLGSVALDGTGTEDFSSATSPSFSPSGTGTYCFAAVYAPASNSVEPSSDNASGVVDPNECVVVANPEAANNTWLTADTLTPTATPPATPTTGTIDNSGEALWYDFAIQPDQQVQVSLNNPPADYEVAVFSDINQTFAAETSSTNLAALEAESPSSGSSYNQIAPATLAPATLAPATLAPATLAPATLAPATLAPATLAQAGFSPATLAPATLAATYSSAVIDNLLAVSSTLGAVDKSVTADTWNDTGNFYVAVYGNNGAYSANPFSLTVTVTGGPCQGLTLNDFTTDLPNIGLPNPVSATDKYYSTVIVDNTGLMPAAAPDQPLGEALQDLATVEDGVVVDVSQSAQVDDLAHQAQYTDAVCPYAEDLEADAIQNIINSYRNPNDNGANLEYVVIVGDDDVVPFFRYADNGGLGPESDYSPPLSTTSPADAALQAPDYLSDDQYGAANELTIQGTTVPLETAAVGRLVESSADILQTVRNFLPTTESYSVGNQVVYGLGNQGVNPTSTLVTGYDFMQPPASEVEAAFAAGNPHGTNSTLITEDGTPTSSTCPSSSFAAPTFAAPVNTTLDCAWTAPELATTLSTNSYGLVFLGGHFSANNLLAADDTSTLTTNQFATEVGTDLQNSLVISAGCHSGYNIDQADGITGTTDDLAWPQAFTEAGATLIAGTGYQYGDTNYVAYSDQIYVDLAQQMGYEPSGAVQVGTALLAAKQQYLSGLDQLNGIEEKALLQITLYGLPMLGLQEQHPATAPGTSNGVIGSVTAEPSNPGTTLGLQYADYDFVPTLAGDELTLPPNAPQGTGTEYTYDSGPQGVVADPGAPVLPLQTENVTYPGSTNPPGTLRGVGFLGGSYSDSSGVNPLTGDPVTDTGNPSVTAFSSPVYYPQTMWNPNYFTALLDGSNTTNLAFTPVQYDSPGTSTDMRTYGDVDVRLFYSNYEDQGADANLPALAAAPQISAVTSTTDGDMVNVSATVTGDPSAGISEVWVTYTGDTSPDPLYGSWQSVALTQNAVNSTLWTGSFTDANAGEGVDSVDPANDSVFIVQAANGVGEVTMDNNFGYYFTPNFTPGTVSQSANAYTLTLSGPTSGTYEGSVQVSAALAQTAGTDTNLGGFPITFGFGPISVTVPTIAQNNGTGVATATIPLIEPPEDDYSVTASFAGDSNDQPAVSQALTPFTIEPATTSLALSPSGPLQITSGAVTGVSATLTSAGAPLSQEPLYFVVSNSSGAVGASVGITNSSGVAQAGAIKIPAGVVGSGYTMSAYFGEGDIPLPNLSTGYNASQPDYAGFVAGPISASVSDGTQTQITVNPTSSVFGQSVTLTANVLAGGSTNVSAVGGTVEFFQSTGSSSPALISSCPSQSFVPGETTCTLSNLSPGTYTFSASYSGASPSYQPSASLPTQPYTVGMDGTATTLGTLGPPATSVSGQAVTFTANVTAEAPGAGTPTGKVSFYETPTGEPAIAICTSLTLSAGAGAGSAQCTATGLMAQYSPYLITAVYSGDGNFSGSGSNTVTQPVKKASTTTTVVSTTGSPSVAGQAVTYTATVAVGAPGTGHPTGNVEFVDNGTAIAACGGTTGTALSGATWTCTVTTYSSALTHTIYASYLGDGNYSASAASPSISQVVGADPTTVLLTSTSGANSSTSAPGSSVTGQSITYSAAVSANAPGSGTPLGTVTFTYTPSVGKAVTMCSGVALVSGKASCGDGAVLVEAGSPYTITATYQPSTSPTSFAGSNTTVTEEVAAASTKTQLTAQSSSNFGSSVSLKATVTALAPGYGTPAGTVTFYDGSAVVGTATLATGTATLPVTGLQGGSQSFIASYGGSANFAASPSSNTATDVVGFTQTISGTDSGSLSIGSGQLVLVTGKVTGSVSVASGGALEVNGGSIGGALASSGAVAFTLCDAKVGGSLSVSGSTGFVFIGGSVPAATGCGGSSIAGAMSLSNNKGGLEMATSTVSGAASITGNSGYGPVEQSGAFPPPEVAGNTISGALACSGNTPSLTDAGMSNKAANKSGQCDSPTTF